MEIKNMRICIDIDGTICELKNYIGDYAKVKPLPGVVEFIKRRRKYGDKIILYTARHMKSCSGNVGLVMAKQGRTLLNWLAENGIEFDEIYFGKPNADVYIDDNAIQFKGNWEHISDSFLNNWYSAEEDFSFNLIITMAGAGSRFAKAGFKLPKPLIPVHGIPMYRYSTNSLPLEYANRIIFLIQKGDYSEIIKDDIEKNFGKFNIEIVEINGLTRGQAETVLKAKNYLNMARPSVIHNSDSAVSINKEGLVQKLLNSDGVVFTFESNSPKYSYARTDANDLIEEVREKKVISTHASTGTYYFRSTVQMLNLIEQAIEENELENGEFYIAPLYNKMIKAGQKIVIDKTNDYICYGTPEELEKIENNK